MELHPIALGAVIAAGITGLISLLGLIISKEQKTSEFRQQWIDSLRDELSQLLGSTEAVIQHIRVLNEYANESHGAIFNRVAAFEKVKPEIADAEKYYHKILLRINPNEHHELVSVLEKMRELFGSGQIPSSTELHSIETELVRVTQSTLKKEWIRVKSGELTFKIAKIVALLILIISMSAGVALMFSGSSSASGSNNQIQVTPKSSATD